MAEHHHLGDFEQRILLAIMRLGADAYGFKIRAEIEKERGGRMSLFGSVYLALVRMEEKGLVQSRLEELTPEMGADAKRLFMVIASGKEALNTSTRAMQRTGTELFLIISEESRLADVTSLIDLCERSATKGSTP